MLPVDSSGGQQQREKAEDQSDVMKFQRREDVANLWLRLAELCAAATECVAELACAAAGCAAQCPHACPGRA